MLTPGLVSPSMGSTLTRGFRFMADVDVRVGTGSFDDFDVHIDTTCPTVPREGETIVVDRGAGQVATYTVKAIQYAVGNSDQLIGARVLVERQVPVEEWLESMQPIENRPRVV